MLRILRLRRCDDWFEVDVDVAVQLLLKVGLKVLWYVTWLSYWCSLLLRFLHEMLLVSWVSWVSKFELDPYWWRCDRMVCVVLRLEWAKSSGRGERTSTLVE